MIASIIDAAYKDGRSYLYEHEVYKVIQGIGIKLPVFFFSENPDKLKLPSTGFFVVKLVASSLVHKTGLDAIRVKVDAKDVISTAKEMLDQFPINYAAWIEANEKKTPKEYLGKKGDALIEAIRKSVRGVLVTEFYEHDNQRGSEIQIGGKKDPAFGPVLIFGMGGTQADVYISNRRISKEFLSMGIIGMEPDLMAMIQAPSTLHKELPGNRRGENPLGIEKRIMLVLQKVSKLMSKYSTLNNKAKYHITRFEINPLSTLPDILALDGVLQFEPAEIIDLKLKRPYRNIEYVLNPKSVAIAGLSTKQWKYIDEVFEKLHASGVKTYFLTVKADELFDVMVKRYPSYKFSRSQFIDDYKNLPKVDLVYTGIKAEYTPGLVKGIVENKSSGAIYIMSGGFGETKAGKDAAAQLKKIIDKGPDIAIVGPNSVGNSYRTGNIETTFVPPPERVSSFEKGKKNVALICQSGGKALVDMSAMVNSVSPDIVMTIGNVADMSHQHFLKWLGEMHPEIDVYAFYIESFKPGQGLEFAKLARNYSKKGKTVIVYKAGTSPEGASATETHTGKAAGQYQICESAMIDAGVLIISTMPEYVKMVEMASCLHGMNLPGGIPRLGGMSHAGYGKGAIADNTVFEGKRYFKLTDLAPATRDRISKIFKDHNVTFIDQRKSVLDLGPNIANQGFADLANALVNDPNVDAVVIDLMVYVPNMEALPGKNGKFRNDNIAALLRPLLEHKKPVAVSVAPDPVYDPLANLLKEYGFPVFRFAQEATQMLGKYLAYKRG